MSKKDWINFKEIRDRVSLEMVLFEFYQLEGLKRHDHKVVGPCPVHGGDNPRAFHADLGKDVWHCFSKCQGGGNQLDFVARKEGVGIREAALRLRDYFVDTPTPKPTSKSRAQRPAARPRQTERPAPSPDEAETSDEEEADEPPAKNPVISVKLNLKREHPHLIEDRGLRPETLDHFGVGYCSRGMMRGCVAFPIHDEAGGLVAYAGRRLRPSDAAQFGKYKLPKGFRKELVLYNWHRCREAAATEGVVLVEGFFTVLKLLEAGLENVVAAMGAELSDAQAVLLTEARDVVIMFDGNEAGERGAAVAAEKLTALGVTTRLARLPRDIEPDDLPPRLVRWLVNGLRQLDLAEVNFAFPLSEDESAT